jgi:hypothetical protein
VSPEAQRIAIAEVCGWTDVGTGTPAYQYHHGPSVICGFRSGCFYGIVPDYPSDLDAMHEAEKVLFDSEIH